MPFTHTRTIRFQDTDAAGVVYFANVLPMCHEAYEESLAASGINIKLFFSSNSIATFPLVHASVDFLRPMFCGDKLLIQLTPKFVSDDEFEIAYQIVVEDKLVAKAITRHVCINPASRTRTQLPEEISQWLVQWSNAQL